MHLYPLTSELQGVKCVDFTLLWKVYGGESPNLWESNISLGYFGQREQIVANLEALDQR